MRAKTCGTVAMIKKKESPCFGVSNLNIWFGLLGVTFNQFTAS